MLVQDQIKQFLDANYRKLILSQIPESYSAQNVMLSIVLKLDLARIFKSNRNMGTFIISQFPIFQTEVSKSIEIFMSEEGLDKPEHGIHLSITVANCPLPLQNIKSPQFNLAGFQQLQGIMIYLKDVLVQQVSQQRLFLFSSTQLWQSRCICQTQQQKIQKNTRRSLLNIIQHNANQQDKLKCQLPSQTLKCANCTKSYELTKRYNDIWLNCQRVKLLLPHTFQYESIFENRDFLVYGQLNVTNQLKPGSIINCCAYMFCKPAITKVVPGLRIQLKPQYSALLLNVHLPDSQANLLTIRPQNSSFFYQISNIGLPQKSCLTLTDVNSLLHNYQKLVQSIDKFKFSYLPPSMLTTLKLTLLNSICNHHVQKSLHLCLIVQDLQLAIKIMYITGIDIKRWPSEYDSNTIIAWLKACRGSIVIVVNPNKKDLQLIEKYFNKKINDLNCISLTFWVLCEVNPRKEINIDNFGVVLDLTTEKNIHICKQAIEESIDLKLSAFVNDDYETDSCPLTIVKIKNHRARFQLSERKLPPLSQAQKQAEQDEGKHILQSYFLKSRELKKTSEVTLPYLYQLAKGFAYLRCALNGQDWDGSSQTHISILDSVLAIFMDEESARNKISSSNTIFGTEISKLILNEQECEISFWDYLSQEDGTMIEHKNYMPKSEMFKKMLFKLNSLLFENDFPYCD